MTLRRTTLLPRRGRARATLLGIGAVLAVACSPGEGSKDPGPGPGPGDACADSDGDGLTDCEEQDDYGTNPDVADTDGDGFSDQEEVENWDQRGPGHLRFNPLVADVPRLNLRAGTPSIQLWTKVEGQTAKTFGMSESDGSTVETFTSRGGSEVDSIEEQHTVGVNADVSVSAGGPSAGIGVNYGYSHTDSTSSTAWWQDDQRLENREESARYLDELLSETVTETGGEIRVQVELYNDGDVSYTLQNLTMTASMEDPRDPNGRIPVGTLTHDGTISETPEPQGPNGTPDPSRVSRLNFSLDSNSPSEIRRLLETSNRLVLEPTNVALTGTTPDVDLQLAAQDIRARTAEVIVDYGGLGDSLRYRVAIDTRGNEELALAELFEDRLDLPVDFGEVDLGTGTTFEGITRIADARHDGVRGKYWMVAHTPTSGSGPSSQADLYNPLVTDFGIDDILLRRGDVLHLVYIQDTDLDGLSDRRELLEGTDPDLVDSDGDQLNDGLEVYGWSCYVGDRLVEMTSNPNLADSDGDGQSDLAERDACTNPRGDLAVEVGADVLVNKGETFRLTAFPRNYVSEDDLAYAWTQVNGTGGGLPSERTIEFDAPDEVATLVFQVAVTDVSQADATAVDEVRVLVVEDKAGAIFVDRSATDFDAPGTLDRPVPSFDRALAIARSVPGADIYARFGFYGEPGTLTVPAGTNIYGGYLEDWSRDIPLRTDVFVESAVGLRVVDAPEIHLERLGIWSVPPTAVDVEGVAVEIDRVDDITLDEVLFLGPGVTVSGPLVRPRSSMGLRVRESAGTLFVRNSTFQGGLGASGVQPPQPPRASSGLDGDDASGTTGGTGGGGAAQSASAERGRAGGTGADGVFPTCQSGLDGSTGTPNGTWSGGRGGFGGTCTYWFLQPLVFTTPLIGGSPLPGPTGLSGPSAAVSQTFEAGVFTPARGANGGRGLGGSGGGGGGGGPSGYVGADGGAGGGGGAGGEGGLGGAGAYAGGGSFGVVLVDVASARFEDSTLSGGGGGAGAPGGLGGLGGFGGWGGSGSLSGDHEGADGGRGGHGSRGGEGGSGAGGPTAGLVLLDESVATLSNGTVGTGVAGASGGPAAERGWNYGILMLGTSNAVVQNVTFDLAQGGDPSQASNTNR